jgi:deazaflavin-dependent oxidoreductase (nitroreductase family)
MPALKQIIDSVGAAITAQLLPQVDRLTPAAKDRVTRTLTGLHVKAYRLTGGRFVGRAGAPSLLLTTIGRRTGAERTTPVFYLDDGHRYLLVASYAGDTRHPQWYLNLSADPRVRIQLDDRALSATAHVLSGPERAQVWPNLVAHWPGYRAYQARARRELPVVALVPD